MMRTKIIKTVYHRNGISGAPFYVVLFDYWDELSFDNPKRMIAVVFKTSMHVAVFNLDLLGKGVIEFGLGSDGNSWRGDAFADVLMDATWRNE